MPVHHGGYPENHPDYVRPALADRGDRARAMGIDDGPSLEFERQALLNPDDRCDVDAGAVVRRLRGIVQGDGFTMRAADDDFHPDDRISLGDNAYPYLPSIGPINAPLTFAELQAANAERGKAWGKGRNIPALFNATELGGEGGELMEAFIDCANVVAATGKVLNACKKHYRHEIGIAGGVEDITPIEQELADVVICASLLANKLDINLGRIIAEKFNATSIKHGFPNRLRVA